MLNKICTFLLLVLLVSNVLYVTSGALHYPLSHVDVWANWLYKTKALYFSHGSLSFLSAWQSEFAHPQYPPLLPLLFFSLYQISGGVHELLPSLLSPLMYTMALVLCYQVLRKYSFTINQSLVFTYLYSMLSPVLAQGGRFHAGMPDLYIAVLAWSSYYCLVLSQKKVHYSWIIVTLVIIASMVKTEGVLLASTLLFTQEKWMTKSVQLILAVAGYIYWHSMQQYLQIPSSYSLHIPAIFEIVTRIFSTIRQLVQEMLFNINNWYIFWWLFILSLLTTKQIKMFVPFTLFLAAFFALYLFSSIPIEGYVTSSLDRLLLQISPFWLVPFARTFVIYLRGSLFHRSVK